MDQNKGFLPVLYSKKVFDWKEGIDKDSNKVDIGDEVWCHRVMFVPGPGPSYDTGLTNDTFCDDYCVTDLCDKFTQYLFARNN